MKLHRPGRWRLVAAVVCGSVSPSISPAADAESPYVSMQAREIKALSPERIAGLEMGHGLGYALAAELNGYPGPKHVLELQSELELSADQLEKTETIFASMKTTAEELGRQIVAGERDLDELFSSHEIDTDSLARQVAAIAELEGRLRTAHLRAHLEMMAVLTRHQIVRYIELRGYHGGDHSLHQPGIHHEGG
jgi:Spy/CpxP family protein refolding chaperone